MLACDEARPRADPGDADARASRHRRPASSAGQAKYLVAHGADAEKFAGLVEGVARVAVGAAPPGWLSYNALLGGGEHFAPDGPTKADDPMLLYFTSGTTARSKLVVHTHASYPIGHLSTMYGLGLRPGDAHLNISSPGWAKHAWSSVFAPWNAGATILALSLALRAARGARRAGRASGHGVLRAPDRVADADPARLADNGRSSCARSTRRASRSIRRSSSR